VFAYEKVILFFKHPRSRCIR